ncbi:MAG: TrkH family potassium uptake protein, partial [Acetatifactor sp.]|nr:TrkH family potassium uptake protein [Acetatifactor sp.]
MNYRMMGKFIGLILMVESIFMMPALVISLCRREQRAVIAFTVTIVLLWGLGLLLRVLCRNASKSFFAKEGLVCVGLSWLIMSLLGCLPFFLSGSIPHYIDALFEMVSGFTTTGATILDQIDGLPYGILYWRSFSHWLGGMGVLVFLLAIPMSG